jgi:site-specific DNA-cytosine methylase
LLWDFHHLSKCILRASKLSFHINTKKLIINDLKIVALPLARGTILHIPYWRERFINVDNTKELTHVSLCAGYGGIDLGLKRALGAVRTIAFSEIESFPCQNLVAKMESGIIEPAPIWTNLKTFPWEQFRGKVDILSGGFPCQPFSSAGKQAGDKDPRHLWPHIVRGIEVCRPSLLFFENVAGIIGAKLGQDWGADIKGTPVLLHILRELERRDYTPTWGVFSASEVGAPHQRKRTFIFAQANELQQSGIDYISSLIKQPKQFGNGFGGISNVWPAKRGENQHIWEPPRTLSRNQIAGDPYSGSSQEQGREWSEGSEEWSTLEESDTYRSSVSGEKRTLGDTSGDYDRARPHEHGEREEDRGKWGEQEFEPSRSNSLGTRRNEKLGDSEDGDGGNGGIESRDGQEVGESARESNVGTSAGNTSSGKESVESSMGGDPDGLAYWMGISKLYESFTDRTDELRLLGNGVVPATAEVSFKTLWRQVNK